MKEKIVRLETAEEELERTKKELTKVRGDYKDQLILSQAMDSELKALKDMSKETTNDMLRLKSDCAQTLLGKEKTTQNKLVQLQNEISDLQLINQRQVQKIHDMDIETRDRIEAIKQEKEDALREKNIQIKQLKGQRDCMYSEIQQFKKKRSPSKQPTQADNYVSFQREERRQEQPDLSASKDLNVERLGSQQSNFSKFSQNLSLKRPLQLGGMYSNQVVKNPFMTKKMQQSILVRERMEQEKHRRDDLLSQSLQSLALGQDADHNNSMQKIQSIEDINTIEVDQFTSNQMESQR